MRLNYIPLNYRGLKINSSTTRVPSDCLYFSFLLLSSFLTIILGVRNYRISSSFSLVCLICSFCNMKCRFGRKPVWEITGPAQMDEIVINITKYLRICWTLFFFFRLEDAYLFWNLVKVT